MGDDNCKNKNNQISLDYIAAQFPKSKYAFNAKSKKIMNGKSNNYSFDMFKQVSVSLPSHFGQITDSSINLTSNGQIPLSDHPSGSTSKLIEYQNNPSNYYQHDPAVLIPDMLNDEQSEIIILPSLASSGSQSNTCTGTPSPQNIENNNYNHTVPMNLPIQQQSAPLAQITNNYQRMGPYQYTMNMKHSNINNNNNNNMSNISMQNEQISLELQYYNDSNQSNVPNSARLFSQNHQNDMPSAPAFETSHSMENMSLNPMNNSNSYTFNPRKSTPLSPTTSQIFKKTNKKSKCNQGFNGLLETIINGPSLEVQTSKH